MSVNLMDRLEYGLNLRIVPSDYKTHAVDNTKDLSKVEELMEKSI